MASNYASALSPYENKGICGTAEIFDDEVILRDKVSRLVQWIREAKCLVVHTGAGISTAAGIADFRGPRGVWTLEKRGQSVPPGIDFDKAMIFFSPHIRIVPCGLWNQFLITQNVDGLHVRSGFPLERLAELHGNVFCEQCRKCGRKYYRQTAVGSVGLRETGRDCEGTERKRSCRGRLIDVTLDWEDALPESDLNRAQFYARSADLSLCLGTTLQITPAGNLPLLCKRTEKGKNDHHMVTINLQPTKHEKRVDLAIHAKVDDVMRTVMEQLNLRVDDGDIGIIAVVPNSAFPTTTETENRSKRKRRTIEISGEIIEDNGLKKEEATLTVEGSNIKMEDSEKKPKLEDTIE